MIPEAAASAKRYGELRMPLAIFSGEDDAVVDPQDHSVRLHRDVQQSELFVVPKGVEHCPVADEETHILLIEHAGTPNTGDAATAAPRRVI